MHYNIDGKADQSATVFESEVRRFKELQHL